VVAVPEEVEASGLAEDSAEEEQEQDNLTLVSFEYPNILIAQYPSMKSQGIYVNGVSEELYREIKA